MNVYVDSKDIELTKELFDRANVYDWYNSNLDDELELVSLTDHTKRVIDKVYKVLEQAVPHDFCWSWAVIKKELEQIQGE